MRLEASRSFAIGTTVAALAIFAGLASLPASKPGDEGLASVVAPATAAAYEAGFSADRGWHFWAKVSAAEVARGVVAAVCFRFVRGPLARFARYCNSFSVTAQTIVGHNRGFWLEVWPWRYAYGVY